MTGRSRIDLDRLLIEQVTTGLTVEEQKRLEELTRAFPDADSTAYERLAGEIIAATLEDPEAEALPQGLAERIAARGKDLLAEGAEVSEGRALSVVQGSGEPQPAPTGGTPPRARSGWVWSGWIAAAAAAAGWLLWPASRPETLPTAEELRAELVASATAGALQIDWTATEDPSAVGARGDVVWSTAQQAGVMRFTGLEVNDPTLFQYQLWIFDATRDERYPVDGGVFDVTPDGEVLIRIDPKVEVRDPTLFAVTVEPPGGVVVSSRERIALVAQVT